MSYRIEQKIAGRFTEIATEFNSESARKVKDFFAQQEPRGQFRVVPQRAN